MESNHIRLLISKEKTPIKRSSTCLFFFLSSFQSPFLFLNLFRYCTLCNIMPERLRAKRNKWSVKNNIFTLSTFPFSLWSSIFFIHCAANEPSDSDRTVHTATFVIPEIPFLQFERFPAENSAIYLYALLLKNTYILPVGMPHQKHPQ